VAVYRSEAQDIHQVGWILLAVFCVLFIAWIVLRYSEGILKIISHNSLHLITKMANLLLAVMATEIFLSGLKSYIAQLK
jgi:multiple antibiotic resistance protein